jgi:hypothetical protein
MNTKPFVIALLLLAIVGSATWLYLHRAGRTPDIEMGPYVALGAVSGEETGRLLNHKGQVVIIARDYSGGANPVEEAELKAFSAALAKGGVGIVATERFNVPPAQILFSGGTIPSEWFLQVVQAHPKVDALVLLAALPPLDKTASDLLKQSGTKIVLISNNSSGSQSLLDAGMAHLAMVPRPELPPGTNKPAQNLRELFNRYYVILEPGK